MSDLMVYIPYIPHIYKLKKACKIFWIFLNISKFRKRDKLLDSSLTNGKYIKNSKNVWFTYA